jgi:cold-inducible RNA-binding protein
MSWLLHSCDNFLPVLGRWLHPSMQCESFFEEAQMGSKLYVGNLGYGVTDSNLEQMFSAHGAVQSAQVIMDRNTGRSKGFGFVEMSNSADAEKAINALNGVEKDGRAITVNEARPKSDSGGGRGRSDYGGGGGGRRY